MTDEERAERIDGYRRARANGTLSNGAAEILLAEVDRLHELAEDSGRIANSVAARLTRERDAARAEVELLKAERAAEKRGLEVLDERSEARHKEVLSRIKGLRANYDEALAQVAQLEKALRKQCDCSAGEPTRPHDPECAALAATEPKPFKAELEWRTTERDQSRRACEGIERNYGEARAQVAQLRQLAQRLMDVYPKELRGTYYEDMERALAAPEPKP